MKRYSKTLRSDRITLLAVVGSVALVSLAGCSSAQPSAEAADPAAEASGECTTVIALINDIQNPWNSTLAQGITDEAITLGIDLTIQDAAGNVATQTSQMQQAVTAKPDGIILQATESDGLVPAVRIANGDGVPVVTVNASIGDGAEIVTFVGVDQKDYGIALAKLAESALPDGGSVAVVQGVVGNPVEIARTEGILETLAANDSVEVVATVTDSWNNADNLAVVQDLLAKYPAGTLDVVIAEGPEMYVGAAYATSIGRDDVKFIAGDFPIEVKESLEAGELYGTILQDGATIGAQSLQDLCAHVKGEDVPTPTHFVELPTITRDNVGDYDTSWNW